MKVTELPFLKNIGLMLTYRCTTACPHCIVEAGPHRKEEVRLADAVQWTEQAAAYRSGCIRGLALTGGEPFYNRDLLESVSNHGARLGMAVSVVSNAFWATSRQTAIAVLESLPAIKMISLSTDVYHQKTIPFAQVVNAVEAARACGLLYSVAVCTNSLDDPEYQDTLARLSGIVDEDQIRISIAFPVGRARRLHSALNFNTGSVPCPAACTMSSSPIIFPNGDMFACIGPVLTLKNDHPLRLGNVRREPLSAILDRAESNLLLHAIRVWGPGRLVSALRERGYAGLLPTKYMTDCVCDACYKLMSNSLLLDGLAGLMEEIDFIEKVAYGRVHFLDESIMAANFIREGILEAEL